MGPYWNVTVVAAPLLLTVPLSVAPVVVTPVAAAVATDGAATVTACRKLATAFARSSCTRALSLTVAVPIAAGGLP